MKRILSVLLCCALAFSVCCAFGYAADAQGPCAHGEEYWDVVRTEPTCLNDGNIGYTCRECGSTWSETLEKLGHAYVGQVDTPSTCTKRGKTVYTCSRPGCGASYTDSIDPLGHDITESQIPPTCTEGGQLVKTCSRCDYIKTVPLDPLGHAFSDWVEIVPATYRAAGKQSRICSRCKTVEELSIPQLSHIPAAYCPTGDANMDGSVTAADARLILRLAIGFDDGLDGEQQKKADFDGLDGITAADARYALRVSVGLDPYAPTLAAGYTFKGYTSKGYVLAEKDGITYVVSSYGYTMIANKTYSLPSSYAPGGLTAECSAALSRLQNAASANGYSIYEISGYRSYWLQNDLYNRYVAADGKAAADTYSARPGHSEHQTGLALDVNSLSSSFGNTATGRWLAANAHKYGFVIRYQKNKESVTGYIYEPWHIRYLGVELATDLYNSGLCLEEFFGITSAYSY